MITITAALLVALTQAIRLEDFTQLINQDAFAQVLQSPITSDLAVTISDTEMQTAESAIQSAEVAIASPSTQKSIVASQVMAETAAAAGETLTNYGQNQAIEFQAGLSTFGGNQDDSQVAIGIEQVAYTPDREQLTLLQTLTQILMTELASGGAATGETEIFMHDGTSSNQMGVDFGQINSQVTLSSATLQAEINDIESEIQQHITP